MQINRECGARSEGRGEKVESIDYGKRGEKKSKSIDGNFFFGHITLVFTIG